MTYAIDIAALRKSHTATAKNLTEICAILERVEIPPEDVNDALKYLGKSVLWAMSGEPVRSLPTATAKALYVACEQRGITEPVGIFLMSIMEVLRRRGVEVNEWYE